MNLPTVRVDMSMRGAWEVTLSDPGELMIYPTLEDASRAAHRWAADRGPSELIVCDAYHRVVHRELIDQRDRRRRAPRDADDPVRTRPQGPLRGTVGQRATRR
jgi:hypothetical protein